MKKAAVSLTLLLAAFILPGWTQQQMPVRLRAKPPEFRDVDEWINTKPLTFAKLRGQVVAVHFWTFG